MLGLFYTKYVSREIVLIELDVYPLVALCLFEIAYRWNSNCNILDIIYFLISNRRHVE